MPEYTFRCSKCNEYWDVKLNFAEFDALGKKKRVKCPSCYKKTHVSITYDEPPLGFIKDIKTVGQLAEKNAKKLGTAKFDEENAKKEKRFGGKKKTHNPWYGQLGKEKAKQIFSGTSKEQKEKIKKYVKYGE